MPKYITNPNVILLIQKLQEDVEDLDRNVFFFPKTLKGHITTCVEIKTDKQYGTQYKIKSKLTLPLSQIHKNFYFLPLSKTISSPLNKNS